MGYPTCPRDPATWNSSSLDGLILGQVYIHLGELFQVVQLKDAITYAAKQALTWSDENTFAVTNDVSESEDAERLAGFASMVHTEDYYGLMKVKGELDDALKAAADDSIAPGTPLVPHSTLNGVLKSFDDYSASTAGAPNVAEIVDITQKASKVTCFARDASDDPSDTVDIRFNCV